MFGWRIKKLLKGYKYRSVPWMLFNWNKSTIKNISKLEQENFQDKLDQHLSRIQDFCQILHHSRNESPFELMKDSFGFYVKKEKSNIEGAGHGVFVKGGGVPKFSIVALYPGTVYYPMEPIFVQSIGNSFILKCLDAIFIDGNNSGISKWIFKSCSERDRIGPYLSCDTSWLKNEQTKNPLSIGQFVNNENPCFPANVIYQELDIPVTFPPHLLQYIPNVNFSSSLNFDESSNKRDNEYFVRTVVLIALRDISAKEELFSSYFTQVANCST